MAKLAVLVDDSKSARIVLSRLLKKNGFDEVALAESGEQALEILKPLNPDAIFVDFLMEGMDGLETISEIKKDKRFTHTPVVMCTANEGENYVKAAVDHGALGILAKPPTDESMKAILRLIESQRQQAEPAVAAGGEPAVAPALSEEKIRALVTEATQTHAEQLRETADTAARDAARQVVHELLQPMVNSHVDRRLQDIKPPEVDTKALREEVVKQVNQDLEEYVRQINERTLESLIEASIYEQIQELANDFTQRLHQLKEDILAQVPEKNDMIEHIRVVTEGTMEAHVRETATHVSQEIANSVATETVEHILDEQLADRAMLKAASEDGKAGRRALWIGLLALAALAGYGIHYLELFN